MDSRLILVVIGVIALAFGCSEAISCYFCNNIDVSNCQDPFKSDGVHTCTNAKRCTKVTSTQSGQTTFFRLCVNDSSATDGCTDAAEGGATGKVCFCSSDLCNDGHVVKPTLCIVIIGVAMATVTKIAWMNQG